MRLVPVESIRENEKLAKDIYDHNGKLLLKTELEITEPVKQKIKSLNIFSVYIVDEYSENLIKEVIEPELRQRVIKTVKDQFIKFNSIDEYNNDGKLKDNKEKFQSVLYVANQLVDEILSKHDVMLNLVDIKNMSDYIFQHSVNVAVISLIMGLKLNLHKFDLLDLCVGALLHDVGMIFVSKDIINKKDELSKREYDIVKKHPKVGYDYLNKNFQLPITSIFVTLQHHERIGGQGYPYGKVLDEISEFSKIVAIADEYDALTSDRPFRRAISPNEALEYIMGNGGIKFDYKLVKLFSSIVVPYPIGTEVKLTSDEIGIVNKVNFKLPLRPEVKIIKSKDKNRINKTVKLEKSIDIVISGVYYN